MSRQTHDNDDVRNLVGELKTYYWWSTFLARTTGWRIYCHDPVWPVLSPLALRLGGQVRISGKYSAQCKGCYHVFDVCTHFTLARVWLRRVLTVDDGVLPWETASHERKTASSISIRHFLTCSLYPLQRGSKSPYETSVP